MNKGIIVIGKAGTGKTHLIKELLEQEFEKAELNVILIDSADSQLKDGKSLEDFTEELLTAMPEAKLLLSLQNWESMDLEDKTYAKEHYDVRVWADGRFHSLLENEVFIEGLPIRLSVWQRDAPEFFNDVNQKAVTDASILLNLLYGDKTTLRDLHRFLSNIDGFAEETLLEVKLHPKEVANLHPGLPKAIVWLESQYFSSENDSVYRHCANARASIGRMCIRELNYETA